MKLSNYVRDAFVSAVMQDVPKEKDHSEEIRKLAYDDILDQIPKVVQEAWLDLKSREYLKECTSYFGDVGVTHPGTDRWTHNQKLTAKTQAKVERLIDEMRQDKKKRKELSEKLRGIAYGCNTLNQLRNLLPEFQKYMPSDDKKIGSNLPVVTNVVSDFVKAGWPKKESK